MPLHILELRSTIEESNLEDDADKKSTFSTNEPNYGSLDSFDQNSKPQQYVAIHEKEEENNFSRRDARKSIVPDPHASFVMYLKSIIHMPKSLQILCLTNLFCWMAHVCYSLYFTDFVGEAVFGGNPTVVYFHHHLSV